MRSSRSKAFCSLGELLHEALHGAKRRPQLTHHWRLGLAVGFLVPTIAPAAEGFHQDGVQLITCARDFLHFFKYIFSYVYIYFVAIVIQYSTHVNTYFT